MVLVGGSLFDIYYIVQLLYYIRMSVVLSFGCVLSTLVSSHESQKKAYTELISIGLELP